MTTLVLSKSEEKSRLARALLRGTQTQRSVLVKVQKQRFRVSVQPALAVAAKRRNPAARSLAADEIELMNAAPLVNSSSGAE